MRRITAFVLPSLILVAASALQAEDAKPRGLADLLNDNQQQPRPAAGEQKKPAGNILDALNNGGKGGAPRGPQAFHAHLLTKFDADQSGDLNAREREQAIAAIRDRAKYRLLGKEPPVTEAQVVQMFDGNGDGQLNVQELTVANASLDKFLGEGAARRIHAQQRDGQGREGEGREGFGRFGGGDKPRGFGRGGPRRGGFGGKRGR